MDAAATHRQALVGVTHAFEQLYRRHWRSVYRQSLRYAGGDPMWAEDLAHDVFVRLLEQLPALEQADLGAWLYRVTANAAISRLRRETSWAGRLSRAWRALQAASGPSPELVALRSEEATAALRSIRRLPPRERVVLCMKLLDGMSQRQIAETLELSEGYISKLIGRALERVRRDGWEVKDG